MTREPLLIIDRLSVDYRTPTRLALALRDVSLEVQAGRVLGVVGESGSGKSTLALSIMRYLPQNGHIREGSIHFKGRDLLNIELEAMRSIWGAEMGFVPQDPLAALNPSIRIGEQIAEVLRRHRGLNREEAAGLSKEWIQRVGLPEPDRVAQSFPHQLSGGMQQRALIAMALCTEPALLLLDEPTTNLDMTSQAGILELLCSLMGAQSTAAIYITHNLGVVAQVCDELAVFYAGEVVERGAARQLLAHPYHPYTRGLLDSMPHPGQSRHQVRLHEIPGRIPALEKLPSGCIFQDRCPVALPICDQAPPLSSAPPDRESRCHRWQEIARGEIRADQIFSHAQVTYPGALTPAPILDVVDLQVKFNRRNLFAGLFRRSMDSTVRAVRGLSFQIQAGETLGLVGESGSGKTTTARAILGLLIPAQGQIWLEGQRVAPALKRRPRQIRRLLQIVFQDPYEAFNPYLTVGESLSRPLIRLLNMPPHQARLEVERLLAAVRLPPAISQRLPGSLSGGERQRAALARAFATSPMLLVADEAISALDVSVQAAILNLLAERQAESGGAMLFISHDLAAVGYIADRIAVIYEGQLMQLSRSEDIFIPPYHPYTETLLFAIPRLDAGHLRVSVQALEDMAKRSALESGCPFEARCPRSLGEICQSQKPTRQEDPRENLIYCHIPVDELMAQQTGFDQPSMEEGGKQ